MYQPSKLYTKWYDGIPEDEREAWTQRLKGNKDLWAKMYSIINDKLDVLDRAELDPSVFEDPNWAFKQAYYNGAKKAYTDTLTLLQQLLQ